MAEPRWLRIGDICSIEKGVTGLAAATPGEYPLVATGAERRSAQNYQFDTPAVCIPLVSSTGHGKKTLNYVHYQEGKFAVGTILAAVIPKDKKVLDARYLYTYLQMNKDRVLVPLMRGAANVSLSVSAISDINIPVPTLAEQKKALSKLDSMSGEHAELLLETDKQLELLKQLRQQILQDAIEGKLTADWRKKNPALITGENHASKLLEKIKSEKSRLIQQGKLKKEKPLPPITEAVKPFPLPDGWVWCRLGEIAQGFEYGSSTKSKKSGKIPVLRMGNIQNGSIDLEKLVYTDSDDEIKKYLLRNEDLLFNRTNSREMVGKTALYESDETTIYAGYLVRFCMCGGLNPKYSNFLMNSSFHRAWCDEVKADALGQSNINATKLRDYRFPLPPLAEQHAIVSRVEKSLVITEELKKQITKRKNQSEMLMQSVLREAFAAQKYARRN